MTRYDEPGASDGHGGPHPLSGIPQECLDVARQVMRDAAAINDVDKHLADPLADAVVMALVQSGWLMIAAV